MFTGIITEIGSVIETRPAEGGLDLHIACSWPDLVAGESIAVDGACLTVAGLSERVHAYGGQIEAGPLQATDAGGFRLWVELPMLEQSSSAKEPHG